MSSMPGLPLRAGCMHRHAVAPDGTTRYCECRSFISPVLPMLDQTICNGCKHGIHAHRDYVSMFVHHCPAMNCAAYVQKTPQLQACTCSASLIEHIPTVNAHRSPTPLTYGVDVDNNIPSNVNTIAGDTTTSTYMHPPSTNANTSYSYNNAVSPQPFTQIDGHSYSQVGNSYIAQYQDDNSSVNVQNSSVGFREEYPTASYSAAHGAEA